MTDRDRASLFMNGNSQAVRLPKAYRFEGSHVYVLQEGDRVILEPIKKREWPEGHWDRLRALGPVTDDLEAPPPLPSSGHRDEAVAELDDEGAA